MEEDKELEDLKKQLKEIERRKEIIDLKKRIEELSGKPTQNLKVGVRNDGLTGNLLSFKPLEENLGSGLGELGNQIKNIPHIVIGDKKTSKLLPQSDIFNEKEKKFLNNFKKWMMVVGVLVIVGYAFYRILKGWLF